MKKAVWLSVAGLVVFAVGAKADLLSDGGFETQETPIGWGASPWEGGQYGAGATVQFSQDQAFSGTRSVALDLTSTEWSQAALIQSGIAVTPGQSYTASAYFYRDEGIDDAYAEVNVEWWSGGSMIGTVVTSPFDSSAPVASWTLVSDTFVAPATADSAKFIVNYKQGDEMTGLPGTVFVDDVSFAAIPEPSVLFPLGGGLLGLIRMRRMKRAS